MKTMIWHKNRAIWYCVVSLVFSILLNLNNDFTVNILSISIEWVLHWILPAFMFFNSVFENKKEE